MGKPYADATARSYQELKHELRAPVVAALDDLRARFDVVVCEGAGSPGRDQPAPGRPGEHGPRARREPARARDRRHRPRRRLPLALRHARAARARGPGADRGLPDQQVPRRPEHPATRAWTCCETSPDDPRYGVLPWLDGPFIDAEDSLALRQDHTTAGHARRRRHPPALDEQLHRRRRARGRARRVASATRARRPTSSAPTSSSCPGTKATVEDLKRLRADGLDRALQRRKGPILGICGGYQMLGHRIEDGIESADSATGLGLLDLNTTFAPEKLLRQVAGTVLGVDGDRLRDPPRPRRPRRAAHPGRRRARHRLARPARRRRGPPQAPQLGGRAHRPHLDPGHARVRKPCAKRTSTVSRTGSAPTSTPPRSPTSSNKAPRKGCPPSRQEALRAPSFDHGRHRDPRRRACAHAARRRLPRGPLCEPEHARGPRRVHQRRGRRRGPPARRPPRVAGGRERAPQPLRAAGHRADPARRRGRARRRARGALASPPRAPSRRRSSTCATAASTTRASS